MMLVLSRLYQNAQAARHAVDELQANGLPEDDIGVIAPDGRDHPMVNAGMQGAQDKIDLDGDGVDDRTEAAEKGAGVGVVVGGAAGLAAGLGLFAIPGIGPVLAAGWLAATAAGAVAGGAAGGIIGALTKAGLDPNEAGIYAEAIRRGATLVTIRIKDEDAGVYQKVLDNAALDAKALGDFYKAEGWDGFDPTGMPVQLRGVKPVGGP